MKKKIKLSKKDTKFLNKIINLSQEFDSCKKNKDIKKMYVLLYKMRVLHGVMIARMNKYSSKLYDEMVDSTKIRSKEYYNLSVYDSLVCAAKELIEEAEDYLQEQIVDGNDLKMKMSPFSALSISDDEETKSELFTDIENEPITKPDTKQMSRQLDKKVTPYIVLFYTEWCGYSRRFMPIWNELEKEMKKLEIKINIVKVDCDKDKEKCLKHGIRGYPTVKLFVDDKEIEYQGIRNVEFIKKFINEHCG